MYETFLQPLATCSFSGPNTFLSTEFTASALNDGA